MDRYRFEMDRLEPRQEKLDELYDMIEGGTEVKQAKWIGRKAAALILAAAVLTITAAAAAMPAVWEAVTKQLGAFAPYAQTIRGAVCRDQGIKVQVLSALADDLEARFYISVQDVEQDRLNEYLTLMGKIENGRTKAAEPGGSSMGLSLFSLRNGSFDLISYDPETKTALFSTNIDYWEEGVPTPDAHLSLTGMSTYQAKINNETNIGTISGEVLESLPMGEENQTILSPSDIINLGYTDDILPSEKVVLAPELNPQPIEGTEDMWISSMGLASDGCFHIRLGFADGISILDEEGDSWFLCTLLPFEIGDTLGKAYRETLVPGGVDILFPLIQADDLETIQDCTARFYGRYTRPGTIIEGSWNIDFQMEYYSSLVLDWTGELAGRRVDQVTLSPLSVTMSSNDTGAFCRSTLYAVKRDGTTVEAEPDTGSYDNIGGIDPIWKTFNTWQLEEPVDLEEVVSLSLMGETIPVS